MYFILSIISIFLTLFIQKALFIICKKKSNQIVTVYSIFLSIVFSTCFYIVTTPYLNYYDLLYSFLCITLIQYSYFHLFNMSETARRIKLLVDFKKNISVQAQDYDNEYMFNQRIERLKLLNQINEFNDEIILQPTIMTNVSLVIIYIKKLLSL